MARQIVSKNHPAPLTAQTQDGNTGNDPYLNKLIKLVPTEIIGVYLTVFNLIKAQQGNPENNYQLQWIVFIILALITPFYLKRVAQISSWSQIVLCFLSFCIWVFTIGGPMDGKMIVGFTPQFLGAIILPIYTLVIPMVYK